MRNKRSGDVRIACDRLIRAALCSAKCDGGYNDAGVVLYYYRVAAVVQRQTGRACGKD
jgi:hypothetical protein